MSFLRSLRSRLILLVLGSVLLAQAATLITVSYQRDKFMREVAIDYVTTTIRTLRAALAQIPTEERAEFVRRASRGQWRLWARVLPPEAHLQIRERGNSFAIVIRPSPPGDKPLPPMVGRELEHDHDRDRDIRATLRDTVRELNRRLDDGTRVALSRGPLPEVFISLASNADDADSPYLNEWLVIPLERLDPALSQPLVALWLAGLGLVLLLATGFSWHIARPLTKLARAADQLASGQPQRVQPAGPREIQVLGERFNAMLDALAESDTVRRTLLAGLPHDLKGPLSRMWLRVEMAEDNALKEGLRKDLQDMQHMVDQFIGFVRGTDPAGYRYAELPLPAWLGERVEAWRGSGADITLRMDDDTNALQVNADPSALGRLLDNLIGNALHHGKPPINVTLRRDGQRAVLDVADHGPGIAAERRQEALRPFARLDDARTRSGNVGLGLALVEAIARAHGGTLQLLDAPDGGLLVRVSLPVLEESQQHTEKPLPKLA